VGFIFVVETLSGVVMSVLQNKYGTHKSHSNGVDDKTKQQQTACRQTC
jgi:hypothetical protein